MDEEGRSRSISKRKPIWVVTDLAVERNKHEPKSASYNGKCGQQG